MNIVKEFMEVVKESTWEEVIKGTLLGVIGLLIFTSIVLLLPIADRLKPLVLAAFCIGGGINFLRLLRSRKNTSEEPLDNRTPAKEEN